MVALATASQSLNVGAVATMGVIGAVFLAFLILAMRKRVWSWAVPLAFGVALAVLFALAAGHGYDLKGRAGK